MTWFLWTVFIWADEWHLVNEALRPKFLDLKEGAIVISLKPFVSSLYARVTERNVSLTSILVRFTQS